MSCISSSISTSISSLWNSLTVANIQATVSNTAIVAQRTLASVGSLFSANYPALTGVVVVVIAVTILSILIQKCFNSRTGNQQSNSPVSSSPENEHAAESHINDGSDNEKSDTLGALHNVNSPTQGSWLHSDITTTTTRGELERQATQWAPHSEPASAAQGPGTISVLLKQ